MWKRSEVNKVLLDRPRGLGGLQVDGIFVFVCVCV